MPHTGSLVPLLTGNSQLGCLTQRSSLPNRAWEVSRRLCQAADAKRWGLCGTLFTCQPPPALAPGAGDLTPFGASLLHPRSPRAVRSLGPQTRFSPSRSSPLSPRALSLGREQRQTPRPGWHPSSRQHHPSFITPRELGWHRFGARGAPGAGPLLTPPTPPRERRPRVGQQEVPTQPPPSKPHSTHSAAATLSSFAPLITRSVPSLLVTNKLYHHLTVRNPSGAGAPKRAGRGHDFGASSSQTRDQTPEQH